MTLTKRLTAFEDKEPIRHTVNSRAHVVLMSGNLKVIYCTQLYSCCFATDLHTAIVNLNQIQRKCSFASSSFFPVTLLLLFI